MTVRGDWLDSWVGRGRGPGGSGTVQVVVTGAREGDSSWQVQLDDGVVAGVAAGTAAGAPDAPDVPLTLTMPIAVAEAIAAGDLTASAAFMQGRMKTAGDLGLVLDVLAAVDSRR